MRTIFAGVAMVGLAVFTAPAAHAASPTASGYSRCAGGEVCFFSGDDGSGSMCSWSGDDADWRNGAVRCSWSADKTVHSIYNHGTPQTYDTVVYYKGANYSDRVGCTTVGKEGNLAGTYHVRSHKWVTGC
ncbi:peptidase inhibitor family I36 protein [Streptomyces sp. NPDC048361]|uniref:peptidase inhibitor family I36 protein n=1 Tax=Streptomyces sp. NPDC048361 TaxID=3154720 RepID=UPI00342C3899